MNARARSAPTIPSAQPTQPTISGRAYLQGKLGQALQEAAAFADALDVVTKERDDARRELAEERAKHEA